MNLGRSIFDTQVAISVAIYIYSISRAEIFPHGCMGRTVPTTQFFQTSGILRTLFGMQVNIDKDQQSQIDVTQ